jgi:hypothetical protein
MTAETDLTLSAWLTERLDEAEYVALGAERTSEHGRHWLPVHFGEGGFDARVDDHIAHNDPAHVLAVVAAHRRIVELHSRYLHVTDPDYANDPQLARELDEDFEESNCKTCGSYFEYPEPWPCPTLRALAAIYADHEDYRAEWAL